MIRNKISFDENAPKDAVREAFFRTEADGIPRHVYADGRIKKYDWELHPDTLNDDLTGESLEEHIRKLMEQQ